VVPQVVSPPEEGGSAPGSTDRRAHPVGRSRRRRSVNDLYADPIGLSEHRTLIAIRSINRAAPKVRLAARRAQE
jgi:hypothetical protein